MMTLTNKIQWSRFSKKHKSYIRNAVGKRICVAEGAIRSGKTIDHCIIAAMYLEQCEDRIHLVSGSGLANAKLNVGDCNGFGLEHLFRGRCRWGKYKDNEALFINTQNGQRIVIFTGGGKADSYKKILGNSYGLWIATEINEHFDSDDSRISFIKVANGRQTAAINPFTLWDLNPCHPQHNIYKEYIDSYPTKLGNRYLHERFTMMDNLSISKERLQEIANQYEEGSVWYRRDILGERIATDGLVYQQFADREEDYLFDLDEEAIKRIQFISIGIDFGGTNSLTTFVATGVTYQYQKLLVVADHHIKGKKGDIDADRLCNEFIGFMERLQSLCSGILVKYIFADSEAQYLINSIRSTLRDRGYRIEVTDSAKYRIVDRIIAGNTLFNTGRLLIAKNCHIVRGGIRSALWHSDKVDTRLDNFSTDIDIIDAWEYSWERFIKKMLPSIRTRDIE